MRKRYFLLLLTIALIVTMLCGKAVNAYARYDVRKFSADTDSCETIYRNEVRNTLKDFGVRNAGITMTKKCEDGRNFTYNVSINLPEYIDNNDEVKRELLDNLQKLTLDVEDSFVEFELCRKE